MIRAVVYIFFLMVFASDARALFIGSGEIELAVKKEFVEQGMNEDIELELYGGQTGFQIENAKTSKLMVSNLKIDDMSGKFSCDMEVFADGAAYTNTNIVGRYYIIKDAYVPAVNLNKGDIITEDKLKQVKVRANRIKSGDAVEKAGLVDKEVKKAVKEGKIITDRDIGDRILIKKGDAVTVIYKTPNMQITAKVEALSDGAKGERIEVMNLKSKKVLNTEVIDANTVEADTGF